MRGIGTLNTNYMATQNKRPTWYIWIIVGIVLGVLAMVLLNKCGNGPNKETVYKTDTLYQEILVHDTTKVTVEVPPKKVIIYKPGVWDPERVLHVDSSFYDKWWVDTSGLEVGTEEGMQHWDQVKPEDYPTNESVFDRLGKLSSYQRSYPFASKFLEARFKRDSLSLIVLDTSGTIIERNWPVFYDRYGYVLDWRGALNKYDLQNPGKVDKPKTPLSFRSIWTQGYVDASYSLVHGGLVTSADYLVGYKNFGIFGHGELRTFSKYTDLRIGVRYIWGSRKN